MPAIKVAIIEDDIADRERLETCLRRYEQEQNITMEISCFPSGEEYLRMHQSFQILFMDIEMPGRNGIEIARELRKQDNSEVIVLVTNMVQYAIHGYEVKAADYIVKPVSYQQIALKMPEFLSLIRRKQKHLTIKTREGVIRVGIQKIRYIESYGHNIQVHLTEQEVQCPGPLKGFEEELAGYGFIKCSQSCLVNLAYVEGIFQDMVQMGQESIPLSRRERKNFLAAFTKYDGGLDQ